MGRSAVWSRPFGFGGEPLKSPGPRPPRRDFPSLIQEKEWFAQAIQERVRPSREPRLLFFSPSLAERGRGHDRAQLQAVKRRERDGEKKRSRGSRPDRKSPRLDSTHTFISYA